jgi:hypothetical protein
MKGEPEAPGPLPVDVRIRFERFPATLKGAFVMSGSDGNPHVVRLDWAGIARIPSGPVRTFATEDVLVDVAPSRDLFIPFEAPITDLEPSWYVVRCSVQVDAAGSLQFDGRPFALPWPRGDVRRGTARLGRTVRVGGRGFDIDRLDMAGDSAAVVWSWGSETPAGPEAADGAEIRLLADGDPLEGLPPLSAGGRIHGTLSPGEQRSLFYPVLRAVRSVTLVVRLASDEESEPVAAPLD